MKTVNHILVVLTIQACGTGGGSSAGPTSTSPNDPAHPYAMAVADEGQLPECTDKNKAQLVWIKSTSVFKSCEEGQWVEVDIKGKDGQNGQAGANGQAGTAGQDGQQGAGFESIKNLVASATDFYTETPAPEWYFEGGYIIHYTDGTVFVSGNSRWRSIIPGGGGYENDNQTTAFWIKPSETSGYRKMWHRLDIAAADDAAPFGERKVFLYYDRSTDAVKLIFDIDNSGVPEPATDKILLTVTQQ